MDNAPWIWLIFLFHEAWIHTKEDEDLPPVLPNDEEFLAKIAEVYGHKDEVIPFTVMALFDEVEYDGEKWLENKWLTALWRRAKEDAAINDHIRKNPFPKEITDAQV